MIKFINFFVMKLIINVEHLICFREQLFLNKILNMYFINKLII